jgi:tetratricopeptide (TPR) repeat protein
MRALVVFLLLVVASPALAQDAWPKGAQDRFAKARRLSEKGRFDEAARAYHEVCDWPEGGAFPQRAQALFCAGLAEESARSYEAALATWRGLLRRFPNGDFAHRARQAIERLDPPGARGVEFARRYDDAWSVLLPALQAEQRGDDAGARPGLEKALAILEPLLADFREHPRASDAALAIGDTRSRLGDLEGARDAIADAVLLARREADKNSRDLVAAGNVQNAELRLAEARRAITRRQLDRGATTILVLALGVLVSTRPWRARSTRLLPLGAALVAADAVLALVSAGMAEYVRSRIDDHSPLSGGEAALFVLGPGLVGIVVALGIANGRPGRSGIALAGACGVLAAAALAVILVYAWGLFPILDSEL